MKGSKYFPHKLALDAIAIGVFAVLLILKNTVLPDLPMLWVTSPIWIMGAIYLVVYVTVLTTILIMNEREQAP